MNTDDTGARPDRGSGGPASTFVIEDLTTGPSAHGFGTTDDGRDFALRVSDTTLRIEVYKHGHDTPVPQPGDTVAVAELPVTGVDLDDPRSVTALVHDAAEEAQRAERDTACTAGVRALLGRLGSVFDGR